MDLYEKLTSWIEEDSKILVIALDEVDVVKDLDDLVYTLTRINSDIKAGGVTIMGVSNKISFKEILDPRSLSTLYETELVFPPYYATELYAIIKDSVQHGFKADIVSEDVLHLIAATSAKEGGDARLSLKILSRAGELAEERASKEVTIKDAEEAVKIAENEIVYDLIVTLPEHHKLVLYSIALLTQSGGSYKKLTDGVDTYLFSGEVYNRYKSITESLHKEAKSERWYRKYLSELEMQGLILAFESGKGHKGPHEADKADVPAAEDKRGPGEGHLRLRCRQGGQRRGQAVTVFWWTITTSSWIPAASTRSCAEARFQENILNRKRHKLANLNDPKIKGLRTAS